MNAVAPAFIAAWSGFVAALLAAFAGYRLIGSGQRPRRLAQGLGLGGPSRREGRRAPGRPAALADRLQCAERAWRRLTSIRSARRDREWMRAALPEALDLLVVCADGGLNLYQSVRAVAERLPGPLGRTLREACDEAAGGKAMASSLEAAARRTGLEELRRFSGTLRAGIALGTPIGDLLRDQARAARARERQAFETHVGSLPTKLSLCSMVFLFPPVFVLLLLPHILGFLATDW